MLCTSYFGYIACNNNVQFPIFQSSTTTAKESKIFPAHIGLHVYNDLMLVYTHVKRIIHLLSTQ